MRLDGFITGSNFRRKKGDEEAEKAIQDFQKAIKPFDGWVLDSKTKKAAPFEALSTQEVTDATLELVKDLVELKLSIDRLERAFEEKKDK